MVRLQLIATILLFVAVFGYSESEKAAVEVVGSSRIEADERGAVTAVFRVSSLLWETETVVATVKLPEGWKTVFVERTFQLTGFGKHTAIVSVLAPHSARAGTYSIVYAASAQTDTSSRAEATVDVVVADRRRLEVTALESPDRVIAGDVYRATFAVSNRGNVEMEVDSVVSSNIASSVVHADKHSFMLAPDESQTVELSVQTSSDAKRLQTHVLRLTAQPRDGSCKPESAVSGVEILPFVTRQVDIYDRFPVALSIEQTYVSRGMRNLFTEIGLTARGALDKAGTQNLLIDLNKQIDWADPAFISPDDSYFVRFWNRMLNIEAGDYSYSLSPLTGGAPSGKGVRVDAMFGALQLGGNYMHSFAPYIESDDIAAYIGLTTPEKDSLRLNIHDNLSTDERRIASVVGHALLFSELVADVEYASGLRFQDDSALAVAVAADTSFAKGSIRYISGERAFPGQYGGTELVGFNLLLPVTSWLALLTSAEQQTMYDEPNKGELLDARLSAGVQCRLGPRSRFFAGWRSHQRNGMIDAQDILNHAASITFSHNAGIVSFATSITSNFDTVGSYADVEFRQQQASAFISFGKKLRQSISGSLSYDPAGTHNSRPRLTTSLGYDGRLSDKTVLSVRYYCSDLFSLFADSLAVPWNSVNAQFSHVFANRSRVKLQGEYRWLSDFGAGGSFVATVGYTVPLGIPIGRKMEAGEVSGEVYDAETGKAVEKAILVLDGEVAVSDAHGRFRFPTVPPGNRHVEVDCSKVGPGRITVEKSPIAVTVSDRRQVEMRVGVTRASSLSGHIFRYRSNGRTLEPLGSGTGQSEAVVDGGVSGILLELKNGTEIKRAMTDSSGEFSFPELRPGSWKLVVHEENLSELSHLADYPDTIDLSPGEDRTLDLRVLPRERTMKMIDGGKTLSDETAK